MTDSPPSLRKARSQSGLIAVVDGQAAALPAGEWFIEQRGDVVRIFSDSSGSTHVGDLALVDFLDGLARREIVFVSWG